MPGITRTETVTLDRLSSYPANPRRGDVEKIKASLQAHGQYRAIVVREQTNEVLAGNHTLAAARALGLANLLVHYVDVTDDEAAQIVLVDNKTNDDASYDNRALAELLQSLPALAGTGYSQADLDALLAGMKTLTPGLDTDPGPIPETPRARMGDLYVLGGHRLIVGDATDPDVQTRLMEGQRADCCWTDPPYGVEYVGKTKDALTIDNDSVAGLAGLIDGAFAGIAQSVRPGGAVYCAHPAGALSLVFMRAFAEHFQFAQGLIWNKGQMVLGHSDYHYSHEPILYGRTPGGAGKQGRGSKWWYGDNKQISVVDCPKPSRSTEHPTSKPVALVEAHIRNSTPPGGRIFEPFCGSGSTLIAAENLGYRCYAIELDPRYADVVVDRWARHTGRPRPKPKRPAGRRKKSG